MGASELLAGVLSARTSNRRNVLGTGCGTGRCHSVIWMLDRECSACGSSLEWWHQLRRSGRIPLCRSHRAAYFGHLSQILWPEDQRVLTSGVLCFDGVGGPRGGIHLWSTSSDSTPAACSVG